MAVDTPDPKHTTYSLDVLAIEVQERSRARVVASFADQSVVAWAIRPDGGFETLFRTTIPFHPLSIRFAAKQTIFVFSQRTGEV